MADSMNLLERFERYCKNSSKSSKTIYTWHYVLKGVREWILDHYQVDIYLTDQAAKCTPDMIDEWYNEVIAKLAQGSRHVYVLAIQKYYEYLVKYNLVNDNQNPTKILPVVKRPTVFMDTMEDSDRVYTDEEIKTMLTARYKHSYNETDDHKFRAMVAMFLETGLRASELCSITVGDIRHCKNNTIRVLRKGGKYNGVIIGTAAFPYIARYYVEARRYADDSEPFFVTRRKKGYTANTLYTFVTARQKAFGIKPGLHNFRHTATSMVAKAGDMAIARDFAGHSNVIMTNRYTHTSVEDRLKAVNNTDVSKLLEDIYAGKIAPPPEPDDDDDDDLLDDIWDDDEDEDEEEEDEDEDEDEWINHEISEDDFDI